MENILNLKTYNKYKSLFENELILIPDRGLTDVIDEVNEFESFSKEMITNIHYVVSNDTIDDAIYRLEKDLFPKDINSVIFLLYKPVGAAVDKCSLCRIGNNKLNTFFKTIFMKKHDFKIGFDSCFSNIVSKYYNEKNDDVECIQYCESGRFSCYINPRMKMYPCSFTQLHIYECDLKKHSIQDAWFSDEFKKFVQLNKNHPEECPLKLNTFCE